MRLATTTVRSVQHGRWHASFVTCGVVLVVGVALTARTAGAAPPSTQPPDSTPPPSSTTTTIPLPVQTFEIIASPSSVASGGTYTLTATTCGTGWTSNATLTHMGDDIGMTPSGESAAPPLPIALQQSDSGFSATLQAREVTFPTMSIFGDVPAAHGLTAYEWINVTCRSGDAVMLGAASVSIARVDDFPAAAFDAVMDKGDPPCQYCLGIVKFLGWGIKATQCTVGSPATLVARSNQVAPRQLTATIESNQWAHFADPDLWSLFGENPVASTRFTVTCSGPDGAHSVTLRATGVSGTGGTALPGTGSPRVASLLLIAGALVMVGLLARRTATRTQVRETAGVRPGSIDATTDAPTTATRAGAP